MIIDQAALDLIRIFEKNGYEAYAVGGCVRDSIMGRECNDTDITVSCTPDTTMSVLEKSHIRYVKTGLKHGTVTAIVKRKPYEITTFRTDGKYTDNRRPDSVEFVSDLSSDLSRRDFTVNAMAYSENKGIVDLFGGRDDIRNKIIRTVGDADTRFNEDALRILRALRFASVLGFEIEDNTARSIVKNAHLLNNIARERITAELEKLLVGQNAAEIIARFEPVFCQVLGVENIDLFAFSCLPPDFELRLASICDGTALVLSKTARKRVANVRENGNITVDCDIPSVCRALYRYGEKELCDIFVFSQRQRHFELTQEIIASERVYKISQLAIDGCDLKAAGFTGEQIKKALDSAIFAVIDNKIPNDKQQILNYLTK